MTAVSFTPHPIHLIHLSFPKTAFEHRDVQRGEGELLLFPRFDLQAHRKLDTEKRRIYLHLKVKSRSAKQAIVKFNFEVWAAFECAEFVQTEQALETFAPAPAMLQIAWPYVRPYMNQQMGLLGLPPYHLPLVIQWQEHQLDGGSLPAATAQVEQSRHRQVEQD